MPATWSEPEKAIQAFETIQGLRITLHDFSQSLSPALQQGRSYHSHPLCRCVKSGGGELKCVEFEVLRLRSDLHRYPEGRFHVCHAGLVEWVLPVYHDLELEWVIFAGVRTPGKDLEPQQRERLTRWSKSPWKQGITMPAPVEHAEAELILEHLRQLAARLQLWVGKNRPHPDSALRNPAGETPTRHRLTQKKIWIRRYIESRQGENLRLKDLALQLKVSEDRATHLIRECCGQSFRDMLVEARLKTAKELLRFSSLPVLEVALSSGFNEISHFNRLFRKREGMSPRQYRAQAGATDLKSQI